MKDKFQKLFFEVPWYIVLLLLFFAVIGTINKCTAQERPTVTFYSVGTVSYSTIKKVEIGNDTIRITSEKVFFNGRKWSIENIKLEEKFMNGEIVFEEKLYIVQNGLKSILRIVRLREGVEPSKIIWESQKANNKVTVIFCNSIHDLNKLK